MAFPESKCLTVSAAVLSQEVGAETVLLDMQGEVYFRLNGVGTRIWQLVKKEKKIKVLIELLADEFDVPREQLEKDVHELLACMLDKGLVMIQ